MIAKMDLTGLLGKMTVKLNGRSNEATLVAGALVGTVGAIQLCTDWNPVGRCFTFWSQLRKHVSGCDDD